MEFLFLIMCTFFFFLILFLKSDTGTTYKCMQVASAFCNEDKTCGGFAVLYKEGKGCLAQAFQNINDCEPTADWYFWQKDDYNAQRISFGEEVIMRYPVNETNWV